MSRRLPFLVAAALAVATMLAAPGAASPKAQADTCTVNALLVNSCRPWFGASANAYPQVASDTTTQLLYFEQRVGRQMDMVHTYHGTGAAAAKLNATDLYFANRPNTFLYLNWPVTNTFADGGGSNATINSQIDTMAKSIKSLGSTKIFLTIHHEPENDISFTCPGQSTKPGTMGTAAQYVAMWHNVRARFDALGVTNVIWVMNYMNYPAYDCMIDSLWPGDSYVDYVSFNGYQYGNTDVSFTKRVAHFYDLLTAQSAPGHDYLSKQWGLVEWGIHASTQPSAYLYYQQAKAAVEAHVFPRLRFYMIFDNGDRNRNDFSFQVAYGTTGAYDAQEQTEFNNYANSPALQGSWTYGDTPAPPPDVTNPSTPAGLSAALLSKKPDLSWQPASDDTGVEQYDVMRDGAIIASTSAPAYTDTTAPDAQTHTYSVRARDAAGNTSDWSTPTSIAVPDSTAPTAPVTLLVTRTSGTSAKLTWGPATDNVAVTNYLVYRGSTKVATVSGTTLTSTVNGLTSGTTYTFSVRARDAANNLGTAVTGTG